MTLTLDDLGLPSDVRVWQAVVLTLVSLSVGVLGGFVGLALGTIRLSALLLLTGLSVPVAGGTNILVSSLSAMAGAVRHLREGRVAWRIVLVMGVPTFAGAFIGGFGSERVPESLLLVVVGLLVSWQGLELVALARRQPADGTSGRGAPESAQAGQAVTGQAPVVAGAGIGLAVGLLGGAVGLILGSIRLPVLIRVLRMHPPVAAGTNLFIGFIMGSVGWIGHVAQGQVDYPLLVLMGGSAVAGSYYGARLTGRVSVTTLLLAMGWVLVVVGALLLWQAYRRSALG